MLKEIVQQLRPKKKTWTLKDALRPSGVLFVHLTVRLCCKREPFGDCPAPHGCDRMHRITAERGHVRGHGRTKVNTCHLLCCVVAPRVRRLLSAVVPNASVQFRCAMTNVLYLFVHVFPSMFGSRKQKRAHVELSRKEKHRHEPHDTNKEETTSPGVNEQLDGELLVAAVVAPAASTRSGGTSN